MLFEQKKWKYRTPILTRTVFLILIVTQVAFFANSGEFFSMNQPEQNNPLQHGDISHNAISISGNDALNSFCSGNGTDGSFGNPHVIANYNIDTYTDRIPGISLNNISKYLILDNITLRAYAYSGYALYINNCSNIVIQDLIVEVGQTSIYISNSNNITIQQSIVEIANSNAIIAENSQNIQILNSTVDSFNDARGMDFNNCSSVMIDQVVMKCEWYAFDFYECQDITFQNSTIEQDERNMLKMYECNNTTVFNVTASLTGSSGSFFHYDTVRNFNVTDFIFSGTESNYMQLDDNVNGTFRNNDFGLIGIEMLGVNEDLIFEDDNLVNGISLQYYENISNLNVDVGVVGQLVLNNVNTSRFYNITVADAKHDVEVIHCNNILLDNMTLSTSRPYGYGVYIRDGNGKNVSISNSSITASYGGVFSLENYFSVFNCTLKALSKDSGYGVYSSRFGLTNVNLVNNTFRDLEYGIKTNDINDSRILRNTFINCSIEVQGSDNLTMDGSNIVNGNPIYYYEDLFNQTIELSKSSYVLINNCTYFMVSNANISGSHSPVNIYESHHVIIYNFTITECSGYAFEIRNSHNISIIEATIANSTDYAYAFQIEDSSDLNITRVHTDNIEQIFSVEEGDHIEFSENWFENFDWAFESEDANNITFTDNVIVDMEEDWYDSESAEGVEVSNNHNETDYDAAFFGELGFDVENSWDSQGWEVPTNENPDEPEDDTPDDTSDDSSDDTTDNTDDDTTDDTVDDTTDDDSDIPAPEGGLSKFWLIVIIVAGCLVLISLIIILLKRT